MPFQDAAAKEEEAAAEEAAAAEEEEEESTQSHGFFLGHFSFFNGHNLCKCSLGCVSHCQLQKNNAASIGRNDEKTKQNKEESNKLIYTTIVTIASLALA